MGKYLQFIKPKREWLVARKGAAYYALEIYEDGIWRKPANWMVNPKWIPERIKQLKEQGWKVRVVEVKEYQEERVMEEG